MKRHEHVTTNPGTGATGAAAAAAALEPIPETAPVSAVLEHDDIARLAYSYWEARGCPHGSPEEDWFRAEMELLEQTSARAT
jgi:hypothetical protein